MLFKSFFREGDPLALNYFKIIRIFMVAPGAWPADVFGEKLSLLVRVHRALMPYHTSVIVIGELYYLYIHKEELDFLNMGHMIIFTFLAVLIAINETVDKISYYYTIFVALLVTTAMINFNIVPLFNNVTNVLIYKTENFTLEFALYYKYPGFDPLDYFTSTTIYNVYLSYNCSIMVSGIDLILFLIIFQIIGHVYILRYNLENFPSPKIKVVFKLKEILKHKGNEDISSEMFDAEENRAVRLKLQECIEHHKLIIGFTDELSELFGPILAINYFFHLVCCSLLLLECSEGGAWIRYGPLTVVIYGQLIQMSVIFEMLGSETEKLPDSAYFLPWECMDTSNRRTACIMLHKMQYKISLKALGLAAVGVSTMTGILKTTFSYYAFLQTRDEWEIRKTF
ncbi:uncharacterized protein LOC114362599 isoform X2 [Ostrinia furnacalis]|uniref:uncharacterized protein LOC114362599 isoform X2 n=1 Tax=Ostrinia furnacalis TaxID=93504 RepID=UPI00103D3533|nr:uncharacterized protein LOC114362599 isoform X2 [Ostrinia furnacalis]